MGLYDVRAELITPVSNGVAPAFARADLSSLFGGPLQNQAAIKGFVAGHYPVFGSSNCPADGTTDYHGALFVPGEAIGCALKWMPRVEMQRAASNGYNATTVLSTIAFGVVEKRDLAGVKIFVDY
jgi:hypothetical protein